jgi:hypothetical protein
VQLRFADDFLLSDDLVEMVLNFVATQNDRRREEHRTPVARVPAVLNFILERKIVSKVFDIRIRLFPKRKYCTISKINTASEL